MRVREYRESQEPRQPRRRKLLAFGRPKSASDSATFTTTASEHHAIAARVSQSATFNMTAVKARAGVASATGAALFTDLAQKTARHVKSASDSATFSILIGRAWPKSASSSATFTATAGGHVVKNASDSATFFMEATIRGHVKFASDSAVFTGQATGNNRNFRPVSASDSAVFSIVAAGDDSHIRVEPPVLDLAIFTDDAEATKITTSVAADSFVFTGRARSGRGVSVASTTVGDRMIFTDRARSNSFFYPAAYDSATFTDLAMEVRQLLGASDSMVFTDLALAVDTVANTGPNQVLYSPISPEWPFTYAESAEGMVLMANGIDPVLAWDGLAEKAWPAGLVPPQNSVIVEGFGVGLLVGRRYAFVRWVDDRGNVSNLSQWSDYVDLGIDGNINNVKYNADGIVTIWSRDHLLATGDVVIIQGVDVNNDPGVPIVNGTWEIQVVDKDSFILRGLHLLSGHYKAGGYWTHGSAEIVYTGVPQPGDPRVARRQILRNLLGNTNVFYVDIDTTDLVSSTFTSTRTDEDLATSEAVPLQFDDQEPNSQRYYPPPSHKKAIASYAGRLWLTADAIYTTGNVQVSLGSQIVQGIGTAWTTNMAGRLLYVDGATQAQPIAKILQPQQIAVLETAYRGPSSQFAAYAIRPAPIERRLVYYSEPNLSESWPPWNAFAIPESSDEITGIFVLKSYLFVVKERHIYKFTYREDPGRDGFVWPVAGRGCVNARSYALVEGVAYLLDEMGIYSFDGESIEPVSTAVQAIFKPDGSSPYRIDWTTDRRLWSCVHDPAMEIVRWFVDLVGQPSLAFAVCWNYRTNQWWLEQYPEAVSSSGLAVVSGYRQSVAGTTARRIFALGQGTLDLAQEDGLGTLRGVATAGDSLTITDTTAKFPANIAGAPVVIVSETGAGQVGIISSNSDTQITLVNPLLVPPTAGSVYQIGGVTWTWKSGWRTLAEDEAENPRDLEFVWKPTPDQSTVNGQVYYDHSPSPEVWGTDWNTDGITIASNDPNLTIDLSQPRGYAIHRQAGHRDPYGLGHRYIAVQLQGVQALSPHRIFSLTVNGAS